MSRLINKKIKSRPLYFEVEILSIDKQISEEKEDDFIKWLEDIAVSGNTGMNHEYYTLNDDYKNDVGVRFYVKPIFIDNNEQCTIT